MDIYPDTNTQFLARMIVAVREGHPIVSRDAERLSNLAQYGPRGNPTMPETREPVVGRLQEELVAR